MRRTNDMTRSIAFFLSLALVSVPTALAQRTPVLGLLPPQFDQIAAAPQPTWIPARLGQTRPAVATNGSEWLAVWSDSRYGDEDLFATTVSSDGTPLTPSGIPIAPTAASDRWPAATWTGERYFVAWSSPAGIHGAHLSASGTLLKTGLVVPAEQRQARETVVERNGDRMLLLWTETAGLSESIHWQLLDSNGEAMTAVSELAAASFGDQRNPAVAATGDGFTIAWEELSESESRVFTRTLSRVGVAGAVHPVGSGPNRMSASIGMWTSQASPSVAPASDGALIVWTDGALLARRIGSTGPATETITVSREAIAITPAAVATPAGWEIVWSGGTPGPPSSDGNVDLSSYDLFATTLSPFGFSSTRKAVAAIEGQVDPAVSARGAEVFAAWTDFRMGKSTDRPALARYTGDVFGTRLNSPTGGANGELLAYSVAEQRPLAVASVNSNIRALWSEEVDDDEMAIVTQAFRADGSALDQPRRIARGNFAGADIAASGGQFGIVWATAEGIFVERIDREGMREGPVVKIATEGSSPRIATDGREFLVVWDAPMPNGLPYRRVLARGITEEAVPPVEFAVSSEPAESPHVTWTGANYLVVWADTGTLFARGTTGRFVTSSAALGAQPLIFLPPVKYHEGPSSVVSRGTEHAVSAGSKLVRLGPAGNVVDIENTRGPMALVWAGETFAGAVLQPEHTRTWPLRIVDVALLGTTELAAIGDVATTPLPLSHANTISRVVIAKTRIDTARKRLAIRR